MSRDRLEKMHYRPAQGGIACGRGFIATTNRNKVTCKRCLAALIGPSKSPPAQYHSTKEAP